MPDVDAIHRYHDTWGAGAVCRIRVYKVDGSHDPLWAMAGSAARVGPPGI